MGRKLKKIELRKIKPLSQKKSINILIDTQMIDTAYYSKSKEELLKKTYSVISSQLGNPENRTSPYEALFELKEEPTSNIELSLENLILIKQLKDYRIRKKPTSFKTYYFDTNNYRVEYSICWTNKIFNNHLKKKIRNMVEKTKLLKLDQITSVSDLFLEITNTDSVINQTIFIEEVELFITLSIKKIKVLK